MKNLPFLPLAFWKWGVLFLLFLLLLLSQVLIYRKGPRPFWMCWVVFMLLSTFFLGFLAPWWMGAALLIPSGLLYGIVYVALRKAPKKEPSPEDIFHEERPQ